ncbi:MAG: hypothetical protein IJ689_06500 [Alphaproteobacteria bacterium]|nr:hypothetical protein [Alphaproteobacteria bacterium]
MALSKRREDDVRQISGLAGVIHRAVMFVTYPIRKPLRCLMFLGAIGVIAYCIPMFYGVKPKEVYDWYLKLYSDVKNQVIVPQTLKGTDALVERPKQTSSRDVRRQMFEVVSGQASKKVDVLANQARDVVDIRDIRRAEEEVEAPRAQMVIPQVSREPEIVAPKPKPVPSAPAKSKERFDYSLHYGEYSNLDYLDKPLIISGTAKIHNANELTINDTYIFLYGIYSNPLNGRGVKAGVLLKEFAKDAEVVCEIIAYTKEDKIATAECYIDDIDINALMVEKGYSDRVAAR